MSKIYGGIETTLYLMCGNLDKNTKKEICEKLGIDFSADIEYLELNYNDAKELEGFMDDDLIEELNSQDYDNIELVL